MAWTNYTELVVWQKAMDLTDEIYSLTKLLPSEELYGLSSQMRRAVVSIPSNIAEGHARMKEKDFRHYLLIAKGSNAEIETQLRICVRQQYYHNKQVEKALALCDEISRMLTSMITGLEKKLKTQN